MWIDDLYVPDLISEEVSAAMAPTGDYAGAGQLVPVRTVTSSTSTAAPASESNPTLTVLWVGVVTSIAGLTLQAVRLYHDMKGK